jgi:putative PIN family toxin of toxin-antitoxin system
LNVVIDTNIIVSALLSPRGLSAKLLNLVLEKKIIIVYDNNILFEYLDVLNREKFKLDKELVNIIINFITKEGEYKTAEFQNIKFYDEDDKAFYELFKNEDVDFLITGNNKHFPDEKNIVTVKNFFNEYETTI